MSTETVDVLVKAREDAISVLKDVQREIAKTGTISDKTREAYQDVRKEIVLQNRSLNTLRLAYQDQRQAVQLASRAFQGLSSVVGTALNMYEKYTVAMIRENQLQDSVRAAQEKYNDAVARFGSSSRQAQSALADLTDAHKKLETAQRENVLMYAGFILQLPGLVGGLNNVRIAFMVLIAQQAASASAANAGTTALASHTIASVANTTATTGLATATGGLTGATLASTGALGPHTGAVIADTGAATGSASATGAAAVALGTHTIATQTDTVATGRLTISLGAVTAALRAQVSAAVAAAGGLSTLALAGGAVAAVLIILTLSYVRAQEELAKYGRAFGATAHEIMILEAAARRLGIIAIYPVSAVDILIERIKAGTADLRDFGDEGARLVEKIRQTGKGFEDQAASLVATSIAHRELAQTIATLTAQYAGGSMSAENFAAAMLKAGVASDDIIKVLDNTVVHVITWKEQFIQAAESAAIDFKDAFTGPMAEIGPNMRVAMDNLLTVTHAAIQVGLIGQAQSEMEAFRDCVSKKMFDLPLLQDRAMSDLVLLTNAAINTGLRGEAQKNIALFVECAQSKQLRMVDQIDEAQQELLKIYDDNTEKIKRLTAHGLDDEAQLYKDSNADILTSISQLMFWRDAIITGKKIPDPFAGMSDYSVNAQDTVAAFIAKLDEIPEARETILSVNNTKALSGIEAVLGALAKIHDVTLAIGGTVETAHGVGMSFQKGGIIPETGPYLLHAGELVIPKSQAAPIVNVAASPVNLTMPIRLDVDGQTMYQIIEKRIVNSYQYRKW